MGRRINTFYTKGPRTFLKYDIFEVKGAGQEGLVANPEEMLNTSLWEGSTFTLLCDLDKRINTFYTMGPPSFFKCDIFET